MRVGFSGVRGVGKTTLIEATNWDRFVPESFHFFVEKRSIEEFTDMGVPLYEMGGDFTHLFMAYHHVYLHGTNDNFASDWTIWDVLAMSNLAYEQSRISYGIKNKVEDIFHILISQYDIVFYIPPEYGFSEEIGTSNNKEFSNDLERHFLRTKDDVPNLRVLSGSVLEITEQIGKTISEI